MNSYQRLKEKHAKEKQALTEDILALVGNDTYKATQVLFRWRLRLAMDKFFWCNATSSKYFGGLDPARDTPDKVYVWERQGIINHISNKNENP